MFNHSATRHVLFALGLALSQPVLCAVSPELAAQLDLQLTPMGAERAGNADGSIPSWDGGFNVAADRKLTQ